MRMIPYSHSYFGNFEFYFETGMEQMGCIFHDDRGISKNPHYNPDDKQSGPPEFKTLAWSIWLTNKVGIYTARIFDPNGKIVYEGPLTKDKAKMKKGKYRYSFLPKEISKKDWLRYCQLEYKAQLFTNEIPSAISDKYAFPYDVGDQVHDDLTNADAFIIGVSYDKEVVGYFVSNNHLDGARHAWEITAIDWQQRLRDFMAKEQK